jgi:hypothetical protein
VSVIASLFAIWVVGYFAVYLVRYLIGGKRRWGYSDKRWDDDTRDGVGRWSR